MLKAVAVIKKGIEETQLYIVDREDMCEDDDVTDQAFKAFPEVPKTTSMKVFGIAPRGRNWTLQRYVRVATKNSST